MIARVVGAFRFWRKATPWWCRQLCYLSLALSGVDIVSGGLIGAVLPAAVYFGLTAALMAAWLWSIWYMARRAGDRWPVGDVFDTESARMRRDRRVRDKVRELEESDE